VGLATEQQYDECFPETSYQARLFWQCFHCSLAWQHVPCCNARWSPSTCGDDGQLASKPMLPPPCQHTHSPLRSLVAQANFALLNARHPETNAALPACATLSRGFPCRPSSPSAPLKCSSNEVCPCNCELLSQLAHTLVAAQAVLSPLCTCHNLSPHLLLPSSLHRA